MPPPPRRPRQYGLNVFWALLEAVEKTTLLETQALAEQDFDSLDVLQDAKRSDFARLLLLGQRLGITRSDPTLNRRLLALEEAERRNESHAQQGALALREELKDLHSGRKKLRSLREAYAGDTDKRPAIAEG